MQKDIFLLYVKSDKYLMISEPDPEIYPEYDDYFKGDKLPDEWIAKGIEIKRKNRPLLDFIGWMQRAPAITDYTKKILEQYISKFVQFVYITSLKRKKIFALNVIQSIDCLDLYKSEIKYSSNGDRILYFKSYYFDEKKIDEIKEIPIFKVPQVPDEIFVNKKFADYIVSKNLRGVGFAYPIKAFSYLFEDDVTNIDKYFPDMP